MGGVARFGFVGALVGWLVARGLRWALLALGGWAWGARRGAWLLSSLGVAAWLGWLRSALLALGGRLVACGKIALCRFVAWVARRLPFSVFCRLACLVGCPLLFNSGLVGGALVCAFGPPSLGRGPLRVLVLPRLLVRACPSAPRVLRGLSLRRGGRPARSRAGRWLALFGGGLGPCGSSCFCGLRSTLPRLGRASHKRYLNGVVGCSCACAVAVACTMPNSTLVCGFVLYDDTDDVPFI